MFGNWKDVEVIADVAGIKVVRQEQSDPAGRIRRRIYMTSDSRSYSGDQTNRKVDHADPLHWAIGVLEERAKRYRTRVAGYKKEIPRLEKDATKIEGQVAKLKKGKK